MVQSNCLVFDCNHLDLPGNRLAEMLTLEVTETWLYRGRTLSRWCTGLVCTVFES